jgi:hypothetical protein
VAAKVKLLIEESEEEQKVGRPSAPQSIEEHPQKVPFIS